VIAALRLRALFPFLAALVASGCGGAYEASGPGPDPVAQAPDFAIQDVNPNSASHLALVSPRQHLGRISAWYFGHAT
jgi:hypothetical protein